MSVLEASTGVGELIHAYPVCLQSGMQPVYSHCSNCIEMRNSEDIHMS